MYVINKWFIYMNVFIYVGEIIDDDIENKEQSIKYKLFGVVVYSGQVSGGYYYFYIFYRQG